MNTLIQTGSAPVGPRLKVVVDRSACCGYGLCADLCPQIYKLDGNGIVYVEQALIPVALEIAAREGAESCPQAAIEVLAVEDSVESGPD